MVVAVITVVTLVTTVMVIAETVITVVTIVTRVMVIAETAALSTGCSNIFLSDLKLLTFLSIGICATLAHYVPLLIHNTVA